MVIVNSSAALTQHPARQGVMDFLRVIVLDSLPLNVTGKAAPVSNHGHNLVIRSLRMIKYGGLEVFIHFAKFFFQLMCFFRSECY